MLRAMADKPAPHQDDLWKEYSRAFRDWDDLTLARWLAQTLGQIEGRVWRVSHPLMESYRLGAQLAHDRQIWHKRLATAPAAYSNSPCCRAPKLPLITRDVKETGLLCQHCNETLVPFDEIPNEVRPQIEAWADEYAPVHQVAHWDDRQQKRTGNYSGAFEKAAQDAERLLARSGYQLCPMLLDHFPAIVWEDHDECLEVQPEDITEAKAGRPE